MKTKPTDLPVTVFIAAIADEKRRADCRAVLGLMQEITGAEPKMWGASMVGFGRYRYRHESGRDGEWFLTGFSPRKSDLTLYLTTGFESPPELMQKLGKHKSGRSCLSVRKLEDIDFATLRELLVRSVAAAPDRIE
jgi:hypothetical protein